MISAEQATENILKALSPAKQANTRTIAQISSHPGAFGAGHNKTAPGVYALCTDGTLWWRAQGREHAWAQLPPIPMERT